MRWRGLNSIAWGFLLVVGSVTARADFHQDMLIVELRFNGQSYGDAFVLTDESGDFFIERSWLDRWEVVTTRPASSRQHDGKDYVALSAFDGATTRLDPYGMVLDITMPPAHLPTRVMDLRSRGDIEPTANLGAYLDYDWNYQQESSASVRMFSGLLRPVVFGPQGNVTASLLYRSRSGDEIALPDSESNGLTVLDLTYTRDDPANIRSLRVGDIISRAGTLGRSLRIGGVQFATNFGTQPRMVTYPLPSFFGETAVPTALDLYINGQLFRREQVAPGNYILEDIPVVNGAGQMEIVTQDALGRQQTFVQDFYVSTSLLREGLDDYSLSLGALRKNYALESFDYGEIAGSATWRHGLRDYLTVEGHLEFGEDVSVVTGAAQYQPTSGGIVSTGFGVSNSDAGTGGQWLLGYQQSANFFSYNLRFSGTTNKFALVGIDEPQPSLQIFASGGFNAPIRGTIGAAITHQDFRDRPDRSIVSFNYSTSIRHRLSVAAVASFISSEEDDYTVGVRFSMPFGRRHFASGGVSVRKDSTQVQAEVRRSLPLGPGWGYHVAVNRAGETFLDAGAIAQNDFGTYSANVRSHGEGTEWQMGSSGSVATLGGMTRVSRQVREAFAVVDVGDYEGVRVYSENREVGRTNANGQVFVPGLRPYQRNQISIEVDDLPLSAHAKNLKIDTAPYLRSGVVVDFEVTEARDAMIHVVLPDGTPVRQGAVARVFGAEEWSPVGSDGRVYLRGLDKPSQVTVRWNGSVCDFVVPRPEGGSMIPNLGEFTCEPRAYR